MSSKETESKDLLNEMLKVKRDIFLWREKYNEIVYTKRPTTSNERENACSSFNVNANQLSHFYNEKKLSNQRAKTARSLKRDFFLR